MFKSYNVSENKFDKTSKGSRDKVFKNNEIDFALSEKPNNDLMNQTGDNNDTSPTPRIDNIGVDGSQRFSDISKGHIVPNSGNPNISDSIINFNPKKELMGQAYLGDRDQNPNLFSQIMTSME